MIRKHSSFIILKDNSFVERGKERRKFFQHVKCVACTVWQRVRPLKKIKEARGKAREERVALQFFLKWQQLFWVACSKKRNAKKLILGVLQKLSQFFLGWRFSSKMNFRTVRASLLLHWIHVRGSLSVASVFCYIFFKKDFFLRFDVLRLRSIFQLLFNLLRILVKKLLDESEIWPTKFCCSLLTAFARFICVSC